jgi:hypothetical protein
MPVRAVLGGDVVQPDAARTLRLEPRDAAAGDPYARAGVRPSRRARR